MHAVPLYTTVSSACTAAVCVSSMSYHGDCLRCSFSMHCSTPAQPLLRQPHVVLKEALQQLPLRHHLQAHDNMIELGGHAVGKVGCKRCLLMSLACTVRSTAEMVLCYKQHSRCCGKRRWELAPRCQLPPACNIATPRATFRSMN